MSARTLRERQAQASENVETVPDEKGDISVIAIPINKNNYIQKHQRQLDEKLLASSSADSIQKTSFNYFGLPGVGKISNINRDILLRIKFSLQSGIHDEVQWALNKLVYISNKSSQLLNLHTNSNNQIIQNIIFVELIQKIIDSNVGNMSLFLSNRFQINSSSNFVINHILDSLLIIRNLCQDSENAYIFSSNEMLKLNLLTILLYASEDNLQSYLYDNMYDCFIKIYQFVIDITEAITSYLSPSLIGEDQFFPLLISNFDNLFTNDRSIKISIMRSLARLMVKSKDVPNTYSTDLINDHFLTKVTNYLFASTDPELILTSLDFLYQFILPSKSNSSSRINILLSNLERANSLKAILPKLLTFNTKFSKYPNLPLDSSLQLKIRVHQNPFEVSKVPTQAPKLPANYLAQLNSLKEPLRATHWMRTCFQVDIDHNVTQISLWKSYDAQFSSSSNKMLPAVDFIKNVTNAFPKSSAMVINEEIKDGEGNVTKSRKFIIKGIKPRHVAISIEEGTKHLLEDIRRIEKQLKEKNSESDDIEMSNNNDAENDSEEQFTLGCGIQDDLQTQDVDKLHPHHQNMIKQCESFRTQKIKNNETEVVDDDITKENEIDNVLKFESTPTNDIVRNTTTFFQQIYQTCKNEPMSLGNKFLELIVQDSEFLEMLWKCPWLYEEFQNILIKDD